VTLNLFAEDRAAQVNAQEVLHETGVHGTHPQQEAFPEAERPSGRPQGGVDGGARWMLRRQEPVISSRPVALWLVVSHNLKCRCLTPWSGPKFLCRRFEPTILLNPPLDSDIMTEEIFGPLLPIITVRTDGPPQ
jgi:hypothetical protein